MPQVFEVWHLSEVSYQNKPVSLKRKGQLDEVGAVKYLQKPFENSEVPQQ